jgi:peptide/nickel transport system ATP-binding protein
MNMTNANQNVLEIAKLSVEYRTRDGVVKAVNELDIEIGRGRTLGLVGETGAGKTTTALAVMGLIPVPPGVVVGGSIKLNGEEITKCSEKELENIRGNEVSMIFQDPMTSLNPVMRVEEQIAEAILAHNNISSSEAITRAKEMLELVGIPGERGREYPHQFSGGMRQRVVIAIALSCSPKLLIADEPTTALDVTIQAQVLEMMNELREKYDTSMLLITHDLGVVAEVCDTVSVIYAGHIIEHGTLEDIFEQTKHPYTEGLFNSLPDVERRSERLKPIKGLMVDPRNLPGGCPFHPRCDYATEKCAKSRPARLYRSDDHFVECHLYDQETIHERKLERNERA